MDPLSLSASVASFLGLAIEVTKILNAYLNDVNDASQEASELNTKVSLLSHVLEKLVDILQSDDMEAITFGEHSLLFSVISSCKRHVKLVYKHLAKLRDTNKVKALIGRVSWPFQKDDCLRSIETLHRYTQTLEHLLIVSNR
jgi:K+-transporting ATPase A subunit